MTRVHKLLSKKNARVFWLFIFSFKKRTYKNRFKPLVKKRLMSKYKHTLKLICCLRDEKKNTLLNIHFYRLLFLRQTKIHFHFRL